MDFNTMQPQLISKEIIKPSIPTPKTHTTLNLSFIDHFYTNSYVHTLFFYSPPKEGTFDQIRVLKRSLSLVLSRYYPFAGRIKDEVSVDCDDYGVVFYEARIKCRLVDVLGQTQASTLWKFFPDLHDGEARSTNVLPFVQVTILECGGMAIGVSSSHKLIDACSLSSFMNDWASVARGETGTDEGMYPLFIGTSNVLPVKEPINLNFPDIHQTGLMTRRVVFSSSNISSLKAKVVEESSNSLRVSLSPSRFEVVVSLLYKCITAASSRVRLQIPSLFSTMLNMRRRAFPPLPDNSIGIFALQCFIEIDVGGESTNLPVLAGQLKNGMASFRERFGAENVAEEWRSEILQTFKELERVLKGEDLDRILSTTSWCKFPFYEVDFGWGKPIWVAPPTSLAPGNCIVLWDTQEGDGIEAWVTLKDEVMVEFELDNELLSYASLNPSPLQQNNA